MSEHLNLRMTKALVDDIDDEIAEMQAATPGLLITRADAVRVLLHEAIGARASSRKTRSSSARTNRDGREGDDVPNELLNGSTSWRRRSPLAGMGVVYLLQHFADAGRFSAFALSA